MRIGAILISATACNLLLPLAPVVAQEKADSASGAPTLEEVIVTARKRPESVLKVPVVETVLSGAEIERSQIENVTDIASRTPGLVLGLGALEVGTQISIRGVGTSSLDPGIDQSVSLNLDGLQVSQGSAYSVGIFDTAQVEVLKGPQSLFFGKNSPGGVVSIRTNDPGDEFEVIGRTGYEAEAQEKRSEAIISGPVTDSLGLRLAAMYSDDDGFFHNTATAIPAYGAVQPPYDFGATQSLYLRGTALFKMSGDFSARLKVNHTEDWEKGGAPYQLTSCPQGLDNYTGIQFYSGNENCKADRNLNIVYLSPTAFPGIWNNGVPFTDILQNFGTLEMNYSVGPELNLTSVTGYYDLQTNAMQNGTVSGAAASTLAAESAFRRKDFTQEIRLNSDFNAPLNFMAGGFYQHGTMTNDVILPGNTIILGPAEATLLNGTQDVDINSLSFFGQVRYKIIPDFEIAAGNRWTDENRSDDPETFVGPVTLYPVVPRIHSENSSPELTLTYTPTQDLTIFGSLKQGYKSGSYNLLEPIFPGQDNSFGDERIRGAEIGLKTLLADRQLNLNLAGYYYKYTGLQVGIDETKNGVLVNQTLNAAGAKIYGIDFDSKYRPGAIPGLVVSGAVNWNHARFTDFENAPCWGGQTISQGCNQLFDSSTGLYTSQNLSGTPLPRAPNWQGTLGGTYEMSVAKHLTLDFEIDGQYSSRYLANLGLNRPDFDQGAFAKINANVALKGPNGGWEVAFIGNDLTNKLTTGSCDNANYAGAEILPGVVTGGPKTGASGADEVICTFDRGLELWLRLTIRPAVLFGRH